MNYLEHVVSALILKQHMSESDAHHLLHEAQQAYMADDSNRIKRLISDARRSAQATYYARDEMPTRRPVAVR